MAPTRTRLLLLISISCLVLAWSVAALVDSLAGRYLPFPGTAAGAIWLLALALGMWSWIVRPRLLRKPGVEPLAPEVAARTVALALAGSRVGAGVFGCYAGFGLFLLPDASAVDAARSGLVVCAFSALGGVALAIVALWLERMCRLPEDNERKEPGGPSSPMDGRPEGIQRVVRPEKSRRPRLLT